MKTEMANLEAAEMVSNVIAILDTLFALNATGDIEALTDSTLETLLDTSLKQLSKAHHLLTTATSAEGDQA